jgi:hypothetical protein
MAAGPALIFDKSALQCLNVDEAVWLDNFFITNLTPLFFVETLADLEKQVQAGLTPEQVVGNLAEKTPDLNSHPNVYHRALIESELMGRGTVEMDGRPLVSGGQPLELEGKTGILFQVPAEQEAFNRWQRREFLEIERLTARAWRQALAGVDFGGIYHSYQSFFQYRPKPRTLHDAQTLANEILDRGPDRETAIRFSLNLLDVPPAAQGLVLSRWRASDCSPLRLFAPYCRHVAGVDLFFYLAIAAGLIARNRPSHKVDLAYLYYLPFCKVFASRDKLHRQMALLFLRKDQEFVWGDDLKDDLRRLDEHFSQVPEEIKAKGIFAFASYPPLDDTYLVTRLWDKHLPGWRRNQASPSPGEETERAVLDRFFHFTQNAPPIVRPSSFDSDQAENMVLERQIAAWKGKWRRVPPDVEDHSGSE